MIRIVGIGEMVISADAKDTIKTFALASCVGVVAYAPGKKVGGIIHIALPYPSINNYRDDRCCYYASTGIPLFINKMCRDYGCLKGELQISLFGGADSIKSDDTFHVGRRNLEIVIKLLSEMNLKIINKEIGENISRTIALEVLNGEIEIWRQRILI